jgi:outer membrane immunogenic protein
MKLLSGILGLTLTSVVALTSANAADMYRAPEGLSYKDAPVYEPWAGFYVGVNGGYGWGSSNKVTDVQDNQTQGTITSVSNSFNSDGGFGGGQIGYNWQRDRLVFGLEADIEGAHLSGSTTSSVVPGVTATGTSTLDWFGTVRGRVGYTFSGSGLIYATGGFAFGGVKDQLSKVDGDGPGSLSNSKIATGYVVGGGVEYLLSPKWSVKAEYQYIDLGKDSYSIDQRSIIIDTGYLDADHSYSTVRLGVNYHFVPGYEPLK